MYMEHLDTSRRNFLKSSLALGTGGILLSTGMISKAGSYYTKDTIKRKLKPVLEGDWWLIGPPPVQGKNNIPVKVNNNGDVVPYECVDHHIFQSPDGSWHLWGCVRNTGWGRILYHWTADNLTDSPWEDTGEFIRASQVYGESINGWDNEEWIQSPYFVQENGIYYMFYGGHSTGRNKWGVPAKGNDRNSSFDTECQICLMTSTDGYNWKRHTFADGFSRLFYGPGEARDPCLIKINDVWHMYYTGLEDGDPEKGGMYVRTSDDLLNWSDYKLIHRSHRFGSIWWEIECPHVVYRDGYFYLFRTQNYGKAITHVFRSEDPYNFGTDEDAADKNYIGQIAWAATEIYNVNGVEFVSSNHDPAYGTQMSRIKWDAD